MLNEECADCDPADREAAMDIVRRILSNASEVSLRHIDAKVMPVETGD
jgi:hypothetical protein